MIVPLAGDDRVNGRSGRDIIVYLLAEQGVTVDLSAGSSGGQGSDRLAGLESVVGTQYADELMGDAGYNYLLGMQGNDVLDGIAGDDTLEAGEGEDRCVNGAFYVDCENQVGAELPIPPGLTPPAPPDSTP